MVAYFYSCIFAPTSAIASAFLLGEFGGVPIQFIKLILGLLISILLIISPKHHSHPCFLPTSCLFLSGATNIFFSQWTWQKNVFNAAYISRLVVFRIHSQTSLLNLDLCAKRVIPLETTIASEIICHPAHKNSILFSNRSIKRARGFSGS